MEIQINIETTLAALSAVSGVCPARSPKPLLQNVLFEIDPESGSQLMATDLEIAARVRLVGAVCDQKARIVLPPDRLRSILTLAKGQNTDLLLSFNSDSDSVRVSGKGARYDLPLENAAEFPAVPDFTATDYCTVASADIVRLVKRTIFCCDESSTRFALGGILLEFAPESVTGVATDGRRLSLQAIPSEAVGNGVKAGRSEVIPAKAMKLLLKLCAGESQPVRVSLTDKSATFSTESSSVFTRLVEGRFPRYADVFPTPESTPSRATFAAGTLLRAFQQSAVTTGEESRGVDCRFGGGRVVMNATAADRGASEIEAEMEFSGPDVEITFDPRYFVQQLEVIDPAEELTLDIGDKAAASLSDGKGLRSIVMPLTRDR